MFVAFLQASVPSGQCLNIFRDFDPDVNNRYDASTFTVVSGVGPAITTLNPSPNFIGEDHLFPDVPGYLSAQAQ